MLRRRKGELQEALRGGRPSSDQGCLVVHLQHFAYEHALSRLACGVLHSSACPCEGHGPASVSVASMKGCRGSFDCSRAKEICMNDLVLAVP